ncbi:hypothetical protein ACLBOM_00955 [Escherichia coli]
MSVKIVLSINLSPVAAVVVDLLAITALSGLPLASRAFSCKTIPLRKVRH